MAQLVSATRMTTARPMHTVARSGFDASSSTGIYHRARPDYPVPIIESILRAPSAGPGSNPMAPLNVVELGPGTGISSRMLLSVASPRSLSDVPRIRSLRAFEPSAGMRAAFTSNVLGSGDAVPAESQDVDISVQDGTFDAFNAPDASADLVVIAQAWHWCPDFDAALGAISRALRPGGVLALVWNLEDRERAPWVGRLRDLYERFEDGTPQYRHNFWHAMYSTPSISSFEILPPQHAERDLPTTLSGVRDRVLSKSYIALLSDAEQRQLCDDIDKMLGGDAGEEDKALGRKWIDQQKGVWEYVRKAVLISTEPTVEARNAQIPLSPYAIVALSDW